MDKFPELKPEELQKELENILPKESISINVFERINNAVDPFTFEVDRETLPYLVVMPSSPEEVSELMKFANLKKVPVFVRGSGTSVHGVSQYHYKGIVLNTFKLNHLNIIKEYGFFECGPGQRVLDVTNELNKHGYFLPMVPGSRKVASMGGIVSNNTSGHMVDSCLGKPGDYILGLQVVLPTGEIIETGTKSLRKVAGTDLTKFFVGGDGLLGIVTNIRMRLVPAFKSAYSVVSFDNLESLAMAVRNAYWEKVPPPLFWEFLDKESAAIGFNIQGLEPPPGPVLIGHYIGYTEEEASSKVEQMHKVFQKLNPIKIEKVEDLAYWQRVWAAREVILPYLCQAEGGEGFCGAEVVSTVADLPAVMNDCINFGKNMPTLQKLHIYLLGHVGALTLHPTIPFPKGWPVEEKVKAINETTLREAELNLKYGTCGGEWGQFSRRNPFYLKRYGEKNYQLVKEVKKVFDPNNILNPGVLLED